MASSRSSHNTPQYGVVGIGFGVTALSQAVALREQNPNQPVLFLERQSAAMWEQYKPIPDFSMQTSFLQDLTTQRNPRSYFTFTNFLQETGRLLTFLNISRLNPTAELMREYLIWSASQFNDWVRYGQQVYSVEPIPGPDGAATAWNVLFRNVNTHQLSSVTAKRVIVAVGAQPKIPSPLTDASLQSSVEHSSKYTTTISQLLERPSGSLNLAIIGQNQEAARIFKHLTSTHPHHKVTLFLPGSALKPKDVNPFVENMLTTSSETYRQVPIELRKRRFLTDRPDTAETAELGLIEDIYEEQSGGAALRQAQTDRPHKILPLHEVTAATQDSDGRVWLSFRNHLSGAEHRHEQPFDFVIAATGYQKSEWRHLVKPLQNLAVKPGDVQVDGEYQVQFRNGATEAGVGVWVVGGYEGASDVDDDLYAVLALRAGIVARSLEKSFNAANAASRQQRQVSHQARL